MAQEIEYRVKLDVSDLSAQLQQIRSQIDQAMGSQVFQNTSPSAQAASFAFPFSQVANNASLSAGQDIQSAAAAMNRGFVDTQAMLQATRLGFQKFNNDVQTAFLTNVSQPMFMNANGAMIPDVSSRGMVANALTNVLGFGYDPRMSITPGAYRRAAGYEVVAGSVNFTSELLGSFAGTAAGAKLGAGLGSFGGPAGALIGGIAGSMVGGLAYDAAATTILRDFDMASRTRDFAFNTSWRTLGGRMSRASAQDVGDFASTLARSPNLVGYEVSSGDVGRLTQEFAGMGGFDMTRTADEYKSTLKNMVENHRRLVQTLRISEKEALTVIKELNAYGMGNNLSGMGTYLAATAYGAGYTSKEMLSFAQQAGEMVRGTGINMGAAFLYSTDALSRVKAGMAQGTISPVHVAQFGGAESYTLGMQRVGLDWATSTSGFTQLAAAASLGGLSNTVGLGPTGTVSAAVGHLVSGGVAGMLAFQGTQAQRITQNNPMVYAAMSGLQLAEEMNMLGIRGRDINQNTFSGYAQMRYGWSEVQSRQIWATLNMGDNYNTARRRYDVAQVALDSVPGYGSIITDLAANAVSETMSTLGSKFASIARGVEGAIEGILVEEDRRRLGSIGYSKVSTVGSGIYGRKDTAAPRSERTEKYDAINQLLKGGPTKSSALMEVQSGIKGLSKFLEDTAFDASYIAGDTETAVTARAALLKDRLSKTENDDIRKQLLAKGMLDEATRFVVGKTSMEKARNAIGTELRDREKSINRNITETQKSLISYIAEQTGGVSEKILDLDPEQMMKYLTGDDSAFSKNVLKAGGGKIEQMREVMSRNRVSGEAITGGYLTELGKLTDSRASVEKNLTYITGEKGQAPLGDQAMAGVQAGIFATGLGGLANFLGMARAEKTIATAEAINRGEEMIDNVSTTSRQLGTIADRMKRLGANTSIMSDPALAMQQMQGEATAVGIQQMNDTLGRILELATTGDGLKTR
jgi:hypothetical protein